MGHVSAWIVLGMAAMTASAVLVQAKSAGYFEPRSAQQWIQRNEELLQRQQWEIEDKIRQLENFRKRLLLGGYLRKSSSSGRRTAADDDEDDEDSDMRPKRRGSCLFHAGLAHNCDYRDVVGAVNEASHWDSDLAPGKKRRKRVIESPEMTN